MEIVKVKSNWWSFVFSGLIAIIYALLALLVPDELAQTIVKISGIIIALIGIACTFIALRRKRNALPWGMLFFESIVLIALGGVAFFLSKATIKLIIFAIGLWSVIIGAFMLLVILSTRDIMINRGFFVFSAILSLLFGILLIINPFESASAFIIISGIIAMAFGIIMMMFGFAVRKNNSEVIVNNEI